MEEETIVESEKHELVPAVESNLEIEKASSSSSNFQTSQKLIQRNVIFKHGRRICSPKKYCNIKKRSLSIVRKLIKKAISRTTKSSKFVYSAPSLNQLLRYSNSTPEQLLLLPDVPADYDFGPRPATRRQYRQEGTLVGSRLFGTSRNVNTIFSSSESERSLIEIRATHNSTNENSLLNTGCPSNIRQRRY